MLLLLCLPPNNHRTDRRAELYPFPSSADRIERDGDRESRKKNEGSFEISNNQRKKWSGERKLRACEPIPTTNRREQESLYGGLIERSGPVMLQCRAASV